MRKIIICAMCLLFLENAMGQHASQEEAQIVVENFFRNYLSRPSLVQSMNEADERGAVRLYNIEMMDGAWCIVSADKRLPPILAFGFDGRENDEDKPGAFWDIIEWYKRCIDTLANNDSNRISENPEWRLLVEPTRLLIPFNIGDSLLDKVRHSKLRWGQEYNISGTCDPSYNQCCPDEDAWTCIFPYTGECNCRKKPVGCGAVAMGQIMWYWRWPNKSRYRTYYWEVMPPALEDYSTGNTTYIEAENVTRMLRDCGEATDMNYCCGGSFTWWDDIRDAFKNEFGYKGVKLHEYSDWATFGTAWEDLIKSELINGRPVLFYGESFTPITGHYFVVDGYQEFGDGLFYHVNWGHRGKYNCFCRLRRLYYEDYHGERSYFNCNNKAIVGISPTYDEQIINSLRYYEVPEKNYMGEFATEAISIPETGTGLLVKTGAHYILEAGREINLCPGFEAVNGSEFEAKIDDEWLNHMEIVLIDNQTTTEVGCDYCVKVENADSWEFTIRRIDHEDEMYFRSAGVITGSSACVWDGNGVAAGEYEAVLVLKNSYGRISVTIYRLNITAQIAYANQPQFSEKENDFNDCDNYYLIPNPTDGPLTMATDGMAEAVFIHDFVGRPVAGWHLDALTESFVTLDVSALRPGAYLLTVTTSTGTRTARFVRR